MKDYLSISQINQYLGCPRQYHYQRIAKKKPLDVSSALIVGTAYHEGIEAYLKAKRDGNDLDAEQMLTIFRAAISEEGQKINWGKSSMDQEVEIAEGVFPKFISAQEDYKIVMVEEMGLLELGEGLPPILLRIDALFDTGEELILVDYKSAKAKLTRSSDGHVPDDVDYNLQLTAYYLWLRKEFPERKLRLEIHQLIKSKKNPVVIKHATERSAEDEHALRQLVSTVWEHLQLLKAGVLKPLPIKSFRCNGCGHRDLCYEKSLAA